jgi:hypothetical protein
MKLRLVVAGVTLIAAACGTSDGDDDRGRRAATTTPPTSTTVGSPPPGPPTRPDLSTCVTDEYVDTCTDAAQEQQAEDYYKECYSPEMAEYRDWLRVNGYTLDEECPYGYATP